VDQSVHGKDFWQVTPEDATGTFSITYNIALYGEGLGHQMVFQGACAGTSP